DDRYRLILDAQVPDATSVEVAIPKRLRTSFSTQNGLRLACKRARMLAG
ncbi:MAG: hypothetical protein ACI87E_005049, partial [Mariniblastus sp.]